MSVVTDIGFIRELKYLNIEDINNEQTWVRVCVCVCNNIQHEKNPNIQKVI